jgi:single-strand DNA-binding protein
VGSLNLVTLIGNLGRDAELRYTQNGTAVSSFSIATTDVWYDKNEQKQERTEWHRIVLWGKSAESLQDYLTKGKSISVVGSLQTRDWEDKDGIKRYTTEVKAQRIVLLGGGESSGGNGRRRSRRAEQDEYSQDDRLADEPPQDPPTRDDSDIPF